MSSLPSSSSLFFLLFKWVPLLFFLFLLLDHSLGSSSITTAPETKLDLERCEKICRLHSVDLLHIHSIPTLLESASFASPPPPSYPHPPHSGAARLGPPGLRTMKPLTSFPFANAQSFKLFHRGFLASITIPISSLQPTDDQEFTLSLYLRDSSSATTLILPTEDHLLKKVTVPAALTRTPSSDEISTKNNIYGSTVRNSLLTPQNVIFNLNLPIEAPNGGHVLDANNPIELMWALSVNSKISKTSTKSPQFFTWTTMDHYQDGHRHFVQNSEQQGGEGSRSENVILQMDDLAFTLSFLRPDCFCHPDMATDPNLLLDFLT